MHKNFRPIPYVNHRDGMVIQPGDRVLFLVTHTHDTDYRFGTYIGCIVKVDAIRGTYRYIPQVRYKGRKFIYDGEGRGHYVTCEIVSTLQLGRIVSIQSFLTEVDNVV